MISMSAISSEKAYFSDNGEFARQFATCVKADVLGEHILKAVDHRLKFQNFEKAISALQEALIKNPVAQSAFLGMIDTLRAEGLVEMVIRRKEHLEYHTVEHAAELADDVEQELTQSFSNPEQDAKTVFLNKFFIAIAKTMAAWHDVVQDHSSPQNEIESVAEFEKRFSDALTEFSQNFPIIKDAITQFKQEISFLGNEFILYPTCLVWATKDNIQTAKTLNQYIDLTMSSKFSKETFTSKHPLWKYLNEAADAISRGDTRRFSFTHVFNKQVLVKALKKLPADEQILVENFFKAAQIDNDNDKEIFLGLFSQNIRIFTELNRPNLDGVPDKCRTDISSIDHKKFIRIYDGLRLGLEEPVDYQELSSIFVKTKNTAGRNNIDREADFANAMEDDMWTKHAVQLPLFQRYFQSLSIDDRGRFMKALTVLAIQYQPGIQLLKSDDEFRKILRIACVKYNALDFSHTVLQADMSNSNERIKANLQCAAKRFL
jgi:hypothetical protein